MEDGKKPTGCGVRAIYGGVFHRRGFWHRRSASTSSLQQCESAPTIVKFPSANFSRRRTGSDEAALVVSAIPKNALNSNSPPRSYRRTTDCLLGSVKASTNATNEASPRKSISFELDSMIHDHQRTKGSNALVRASSGNVMLFGHLGNIRGAKNFANRLSCNAVDRPSNTRKVPGVNANGKNGYVANGLMGNILRSTTKKPAPSSEMCRTLSKRLEPEHLKQLGNEEYRRGRFAEAVAFYNRAILIDAGKASYWSNRAAALVPLGRLLDAVRDCKEAVRIDPSYLKAHHRLATLYHRMGESEKAIEHYKLSRNENSSNDISRAQAVQAHLTKCQEARKQKDWHTMLKEAQSAISFGADSAPQVYALHAEALLKLHRHEEADSVFSKSPKFEIDASTVFFGASENAYVLAVGALVDMAAGRFEDAVGTAQRATQLDRSNGEIGIAARRLRATSSARSKGNDLFKASKFGEACIAFGEGLNHDPHNAVLRCNRAACHSKLGHFKKAIEDCNAALMVCPSYSKARLRRADCYAKLERWDAAIQDYEALLHQIPGDEEVSKVLFEAQTQLEKQRSEHVKDSFKF